MSWPLNVTVGATTTAMVVDGLTRSQIVQYAGASGDYNPVHTDEVFATEVAGQPRVFAHGMLVMGMTGRMLMEWFGARNILTFGSRFVRQVWPGDTLVLTASVDDLDKGVATLALTLRNDRDEIVLTGSATVTVG